MMEPGYYREGFYRDGPEEDPDDELASERARKRLFGDDDEAEREGE